MLTEQALSTNNMQLNWRIADGYYLYKQRMKVEPAGDTKVIGALVLPKGESHSDEYFGEQEIYRQSVDATFSVPPSDAKTVDVNVTYQGCADAGLCYPPQTKLISISLEDAPPASAAAPAPGEFVSEQDSYAEKIKHGNIFLVLLSFFGAGLLLAFTPCVLPMVPILSGIIAGSGENVTTRRSFMLSLAYVLGMAFTYTAAGIAAGAIGQGFNLQATFNQPWIVALFSLLFVVLAASMLGLFTIEMPGFIQTRLSNTSNQQQAGTYLGVGVMGSLSALIVSACVAPPLIAALTVISQTGDVVRGGAALFVMSIGMGTPLLLVGASAGKLLPRAGAWMDTVKNLFGVLFLGVAAWMLARIVPGWLSMIIWAVPALVLAWVLWRAHVKSAPGKNLIARGRRGRGHLRRGVVSRRRARQHQSAGAHSAVRGEADASRVQALQDGRGSRARSRGGLGRRQGRDGRLLCRLVRELHRDGTQDVHAARGAGRARERRPAAGRRHRERR